MESTINNAAIVEFCPKKVSTGSVHNVHRVVPPVDTNKNIVVHNVHRF